MSRIGKNFVRCVALLMLLAGCAHRLPPSGYHPSKPIAIPALQGRLVEIQTLPQSFAELGHPDPLYLSVLPVWPLAHRHSWQFQDQTDAPELLAPVGAQTPADPLCAAGAEYFAEAFKASAPAQILSRSQIGPSLAQYTLILRNLGSRDVLDDYLYCTSFLAYLYTTFLPLPQSRLAVHHRLRVELWEQSPERLIFAKQYDYRHAQDYGLLVARHADDQWRSSISAFYDAVLKDLAPIPQLASPWAEPRVQQFFSARKQLLEDKPAALAAYFILGLDQQLSLGDALTAMSKPALLSLATFLQQANPFSQNQSTYRSALHMVALQLGQ